ncbi:MAG: hypothetical protein CMI60_01430 [Parvibaculum sp.]|nr:hypothetical protein [Parvibaculum sp.]
MDLDQDQIDYYSVPALSHSRLKDIRHSPGHFRWKMDNAEPATDAMNLGSLVHAMVLEPHVLASQFVASPKFDRRTKVGKEERSKFFADHPDKKVVTVDEWEQATLMADAVLAHPGAGSLVDNVIAHGSAEREVYWEDARGINRKAKVDGLYYGDHGDQSVPSYVIDLKTTIDASPGGFRKSISKYCYGTQMAYYVEAANTAMRGAVIIAVSKTPPFGVGLYRFNSEAIDRAALVVSRWLDVYEKCTKEGVWPTYWDIQNVDVPDWFLTSNGVDRERIDDRPVGGTKSHQVSWEGC